MNPTKQRDFFIFGVMLFALIVNELVGRSLGSIVIGIALIVCANAGLKEVKWDEMQNDNDGWYFFFNSVLGRGACILMKLVGVFSIFYGVYCFFQ